MADTACLIEFLFRPDPVVQPEQERNVELPSGQAQSLDEGEAGGHQSTEARGDEMYIFE